MTNREWRVRKFPDPENEGHYLYVAEIRMQSPLAGRWSWDAYHEEFETAQEAEVYAKAKADAGEVVAEG